MSSIWGALRLVIPLKRVGLGVGLANCAQQISYATAPLLIGFTIDSAANYATGFIIVSVLMIIYEGTALTILSVWACRGFAVLNPGRAALEESNKEEGQETN